MPASLSPAIPAPVIRLADVGLTLDSRAGAVEILKGVSFTIAPATSVAIVGPSGSGKTSLLMIMAGLERATRGTVEVVGRNFSTLGEDELARVRGREIGIVFQSFHLVPTMTALENVALPLELSDRRDAFDVAAARLKSVGLDPRREHFPAQLSGGEQQRVALARALAPEPKILFADEPTGNLDARTGAAVTELLFDLHRQSGTTLVLVTHDLGLARRCQRVIRMNDGRVVEDAAPEAPRLASAAS
jgi:putative ABC transport system ATP-binding protein